MQSLKFNHVKEPNQTDIKKLMNYLVPNDDKAYIIVIYVKPTLLIPMTLRMKMVF